MPRIKKKRMSFVIDMTPLVDITFLLLTFLMFTAKFKSEAESEQQFTIVRPMASPDTTKLPPVDLAIINVAIDDKNPQDTSYYYGLTNTTDWQKVLAYIPEIPIDMRQKSLLKVDTLLLGKLVKYTLAVNNSTTFALDADKRVRFKYIKDVMNTLRKNKAFTFDFVTEKRKGKEEEKKE